MNERDRYTVIRQIGSGAMGEVFLAEDNLLKRKVALKFLSLPAGMDKVERQEAATRFYREAQAAAKLTHPNIVTIYDIDEREGGHYISMEYLEGSTLDQVIARGPLPPSEAASVVAQVLDALAYSHSNGVIHRDIKPENIFLTPDGTVKVTDFGIARVMGSSTMTQAGTVMGTPGYMSPEQVKGEKVDERTDIFSCGVVLYELLTGKRAFAADSLTAVMYHIVNDDPFPMADIDPSLPSWLHEVVATALAKDPDQRYPGAAQMASDLRSGTATPVSAPPVPQTVLLTAAAAPPGTVVRTPGEPIPVPEAMPLAEGASRSRKKTYIIAAVASAAALLIIGGVIFTILALSSSKVTVPDAEGLNVEEAKGLIAKAGLELEVVGEIPRADAKDGEVLSQSPAAGQKLEKGSVVEVDVCKNQGQAAEKGAGDSEKEQVMQLLNTWISARNSNDLQKFMSCYSMNFHSTGTNNPSYGNLDYNGWQAAQAKYFSPPYSQGVTVDQPNIVIASDLQSAGMTFGSGYKLFGGGAQIYEDYGFYSQTLIKENGSWKIISESWTESWSRG